MKNSGRESRMEAAIYNYFAQRNEKPRLSIFGF